MKEIQFRIFWKIVLVEYTHNSRVKRQFIYQVMLVYYYKTVTYLNAWAV